MSETRETIMESFRKKPSAMPLPESDAELEIVSELYFSVPLHLSKLHVYGKSASYEVKEKHDYVADHAGFARHDGDGYDFARRFWDAVVGHLYCGGIAGSSYGQTRIPSHRHKKRLERWVSSRRGNESGRLRKPFVRLARHCWGEREQGDSR